MEEINLLWPLLVEASRAGNTNLLRTEETHADESWLQVLRAKNRRDALDHYLKLTASQVVSVNTVRVEAERYIDSEPMEDLETFAAERGEAEQERLSKAASLVGLKQSQKVVDRYVRPGRIILREECEVTKDAIARLVTTKKFVPSRSEQLWKDALVAGFEGDFVEAYHYLVVRLEEALRYHVQYLGYCASEKLPRLRDIVEAVGGIEPGKRNIFTPTDLSVFKWIFSDPRWGISEHVEANARNLFAHGCQHDQILSDPLPPYLWWFALRLVSIGPQYAGSS